MQTDRIMTWAGHHPEVAVPTAVAGALGVAVVVWLLQRRVSRALKGWTPAPAQRAGIAGILLATGLEADTAWRFAGNRLGISHPLERGLLFLVGETVLFTFALMARANLLNEEKRRAGAPGILVWVICGALAVPAISESGSVAAAWVRVLFGPVAAALLWHFLMGIELRSSLPSAQSMGTFSVLMRHLRERALSRFGVIEADRTAVDMARDRAVVRAAILSERYQTASGRRQARLLRRLRKALRTAGVAGDPGRREALLAEIATSRFAKDLGTTPVDSPWADTTAATPAPAAARTRPRPVSLPVPAQRELEADDEPRTLPANASTTHEPQGDRPMAVDTDSFFSTSDLTPQAAVETRAERERRQAEAQRRADDTYAKAVEVVVELVQQGAPLSGPQIAEQLPVGPRTVQRYIKRMREEGVLPQE
ncbi:hypothetical protein RVR_P2105 (plasmid) [Actinacidiphila reveromycinica]|uniref:Uncharacterized protein n=1 Tax=Actinacidiphila reveromycinica TaxID=659352 RepID=A0A7R6QI11_9ACTN|nr:HTH domain-containing protein [Streptomyces sp. SN-593]BBG20745.1 hypothetical protein RVR_P2105 [Streptomyces sp. SN-593]